MKKLLIAAALVVAFAAPAVAQNFVESLRVHDVGQSINPCGR